MIHSPNSVWMSKSGRDQVKNINSTTGFICYPGGKFFAEVDYPPDTNNIDIPKLSNVFLPGNFHKKQFLYISLKNTRLF